MAGFCSMHLEDKEWKEWKELFEFEEQRGGIRTRWPEKEPRITRTRGIGFGDWLERLELDGTEKTRLHWWSEPLSPCFYLNHLWIRQVKRGFGFDLGGLCASNFRWASSTSFNLRQLSKSAVWFSLFAHVWTQGEYIGEWWMISTDASFNL